MDNSDELIEVSAVEKLRYAVEMKKINDELMEHLATSLTWVLHYCYKNNLPLPNQDKINRIVNRALSLVDQIPQSTENLQKKNQSQNGQNLKTGCGTLMGHNSTCYLSGHYDHDCCFYNT